MYSTSVGTTDRPFDARLAAGERILWSGTPDRRAYTLRGPLLLIPFSIMWAGFAFFWEASVLSMGGSGFFALWGIPFCVLGVYMVAGRFMVAAREAARTAYAITTSRVMFLTGAFARRYTELSLASLPPPQLDERADGVGTITFGVQSPMLNWVPAGWPMAGMASPAFVSIPNAGRVFQVLTQAKAGLT